MKQKMKKTQDILFTIVFILFLFIARSFAADSALNAMQKVEKLEKEETAAPPAVINRPNVEYKASRLRDPFLSLIVKDIESAEEAKASEAAAKPLPALTVQGIIWGGSFPQAIINNKVVKAGDNIEGVSINSIDKSGIAVFFEGRYYELSSPAGGSAVTKKP